VKRIQMVQCGLDGGNAIGFYEGYKGRKRYEFKKHVYAPPYTPYYDAYKGHVFVIDHYHPDKDATDHVWLICVDDPKVKVLGYVEIGDLKRKR
jgi:hypothetical protein